MKTTLLQTLGSGLNMVLVCEKRETGQVSSVIALMYWLEAVFRSQTRREEFKQKSRSPDELRRQRLKFREARQLVWGRRSCKVRDLWTLAEGSFKFLAECSSARL